MVPIIYANDNGAYFMSCNNSITVGNVRIPSRVFLAPLSGISDQPFRKIVNKYSIKYFSLLDHFDGTLEVQFFFIFTSI